MSTHKSARIHYHRESQDIVSSMSFFIKNHRDPEQLFRQMSALYASGQLFEVSSLSQCIIDEYNANIENAEFFILSARTEIELYGWTSTAAELITQARTIDSKNDVVMAYFRLATAVNELKDGLYEQGEESLKALLMFSELRPYAQYLLGHHLFWKRNATAEAAELLESATKERSQFLVAWTDLALINKRAGERLKANYAWQTCLKLDRNPERRAFYQKHLECL